MDFIELVDVEEKAKLLSIVGNFETAVAEVMSLLVEMNVICHLPVSQGKDSTVTELIVCEAYIRCVAQGLIEASRPLIVSTGNPGGDAIPMNMYVRYAKKRLVKYMQERGVNISYDIVKPPLNDEFFVRYAGGQSLVPNAARAGTCSVILKVDPAHRYVKNMLQTLGQSHKNCLVVSMVGSRVDESKRRSESMGKMQLKRGIDALKAELENVTVGSNKITTYAPIKDWPTNDVFDALRLAGDRPLKRIQGAEGTPIPAFLSNFGLLLEIYGNGSNEVCEVSIGSNKTSGCGGKSRFGCVFCPMVGKTDNSSTALSRLVRWDILGATDALRLRDYIWRLSNDMGARAFHARAYDAAGYLRAALQPNTLKPKYLEKMIRYAAQLTINSQRMSEEFAELVRTGREMEHAGYREIAEDMMIPPKTKRAFLEMYSEGLQDPECLYNLFTEAHAIMLSFRWSADGVGAVPFRPLAIYEQLKTGRGWVPFPRLNSEMTDAELTAGKTALPEAILVPLLNNESPVEFASNPLQLEDLWQRPFNTHDVEENLTNCALETVAKQNVIAEASIETPFEVVHGNVQDAIKVKGYTDTYAGLFSVILGETVVEQIRINGKVVAGNARAMLMSNGLQDLIDKNVKNFIAELAFQFDVHFESVDTAFELLQKITAKFFDTQTIKVQVPYMTARELNCGYTLPARQVQPAINFTRRVTRVDRDGTMSRGNTRMVFYPLQNSSRMHRAHKQTTTVIEPAFGILRQKEFNIHNYNNDLLETNISIDAQQLREWLENGFKKFALEMHDNYFSMRYGHRHQRNAKPHSLREYGGTAAAEHLMEYGVISINAQYLPRFKQIIRRTQVFESLGLYDFQSMNAEEVLAKPYTISMTQHRHDKAVLMNEVRKLRNAQRRAVKSALSCAYDGNVSVNLQWLEQNAQASIATATHAYFNNLLNIEFDTHEVAPSTRANVSRLWLNLHLEALNSTEDYLALVLSPAQLKMVRDNAGAYVTAGRAALTSMKHIGETINAAQTAWQPVIDGVRELLKQDEITAEDYRQLVTARVVAQSWKHDVINYFNPSPKVLRSKLTEALKAIDGVNAELAHIKANIGRITRAGVSQVTSKITPAQKMALLAARVA